MGLKDYGKIYKGEIEIIAAYRGETQVYDANFVPTAPGAFAAGQWSVATGAEGAVTVTVSSLPSSGGSAITGVVYAIDGGEAVSLGAGVGSYTVSGLTPGAAVSLTLAAVNAVGQGAWSAAKSATAGAEADTAPAAFGSADWSVATGSEGEITLTIAALPDDGGSAITALQYQIDGGAWSALTGTGTGARTLTMAAAGTSYSIAIRAVNAIGNGAASAAKSATSGAVVIAAPTNTTAPSITGTATVGETLTAVAGTWTGSPTVTRQWLRGGTEISGATGTTYLLVAADEGATITVQETATNAGGSADATSAGVGPVAAATVPSLSIEITPASITAGDTVTITGTVTNGSASDYTSISATIGSTAQTLSGTGLTRTFVASEAGTLSVMGAVSIGSTTYSASTTASVGAGGGLAPLPGYLDAARINIQGASFMDFSTSASKTYTARILGHLGFTGTLNNVAVSGTSLVPSWNATSQALLDADTAAGASGGNLYICDLGGNDVTDQRPYPGGQTSITSLRCHPTPRGLQRLATSLCRCLFPNGFTQASLRWWMATTAPSNTARCPTTTISSIRR